MMISKKGISKLPVETPIFRGALAVSYYVPSASLAAAKNPAFSWFQSCLQATAWFLAGAMAERIMRWEKTGAMCVFLFFFRSGDSVICFSTNKTYYFLWGSYTYTTWLYSKDFPPFFVQTSELIRRYNSSLEDICRMINYLPLIIIMKMDENGSHFPDEFSPKGPPNDTFSTAPRFFKRVSTGDHQWHSDDHGKGYTPYETVSKSLWKKNHRPTRWTLSKHRGPYLREFLWNSHKNPLIFGLKVFMFITPYFCSDLGGSPPEKPLKISRV